MPKMKIFDWMYRKLQLNEDYNMLHHKKVELAQSINKGKNVLNDKDTLGLMTNKDKTTVDAFHGWHDGILAIGTFGLDHLITYQSHDQHDNITQEEEEVQVIEEHDIEAEEGQEDAKASFEKEEIVIEHEPPMCHEIVECSGELVKSSGCRITLADLFYAECNGSQKDDGSVIEVIETEEESSKKTGHLKKHKLSLAKKLMPWKGVEACPAKKVQRLMTRILRRKVHPDLNSTGHGGDDPDESNIVDVPSTYPLRGIDQITHLAYPESVLLLQGVTLRS